MSHIVNVVLDTYSLGTGTAELEVERHKTVSDLLHDNDFSMGTKAPGPYHIGLSLKRGEVTLQIQCEKSGHAEDIDLPMTRFKKQMRDYVDLCDSYYKTARAGQIHKLGALDAQRRVVHDESAEILAQVLENKVTLDKNTARRLFTLVYVLHMRQSNHSER